MKVRVLIVVGWLISLTSACFAQDVIVTKDARKINAKVTEVNVNDIKYKNFDNLDGPTYTLLKSDIASIVYQNGQVETFEPTNAQTQAVTQTPVQRPPQGTLQPLTSGNILSRMQKDDPILYQQYMRGRKQAGNGIILVIVGGVLTVGGAVAVTTAEVDNVFSIGLAASVCGGIMLTGGIPLMIIGGTKKNNALNTYRQKYTSDLTTPHFQLNLHGNGLGLAYVF